MVGGSVVFVKLTPSYVIFPVSQKLQVALTSLFFCFLRERSTNLSRLVLKLSCQVVSAYSFELPLDGAVGNTLSWPSSYHFCNDGVCCAVRVGPGLSVR